jgi:hypothetical protein
VTVEKEVVTPTPAAIVQEMIPDPRAPEPLHVADDAPPVTKRPVALSHLRASSRVVAAASGVALAIALVVVGVTTMWSPSSTTEPRPPRVVAHVPTALAAADVKNGLRPAPPPEPEPVALPPGTFDPAAMKRALDVVAKDLVQCTAPSTPRGPGSIMLHIHPGGWITGAELGWPYAGTASGQCMRNRFLATRLPQFFGSTRTFYYTFQMTAL